MNGKRTLRVTRMVGAAARRLAHGFGTAALLGALLVGQAAGASAGAFPEVARIESDLIRGLSTKQDVRRVLGTPDGFGTAIWPPDHRLFQVWYYEDLVVASMRSAGEGITEMNLRQQLLTIFFDGDKYDGFSWTTNVVPSEAR